MSCLRTVRRALRVTIPVALLLFAGCFSGGYSRDAAGTRHSAAILENYTSEPHDPTCLRGLPASLERASGPAKGNHPRPVTGGVFPEQRSPDVELPGSAERAWVGPPRTRPYYRLDLRPPTPAVVVRPPKTGAPRTTGKVETDLLQSGDVIRVTVSGHPEFGGEWIVDERGYLDIPDGGAFGVGSFSGEKFSERIGRASGMKASALEQEISSKLRTYVRKAPQVTVEISGRERD